MARPHPTAAQQTDDDVTDWVNEGGHLREPGQLERMDITRTLVESLTAGPHRYKKLADAMAQARRSAARQT